MEDIVDTKIIECNRKNSVESTLNTKQNPAQYTNQIGDGIKLNVGDEVSVAGVYISEIGAGSDTIEFKGSDLVDYKGRPLSRIVNYTQTLGLAPVVMEPGTSAPAPVIGGFQKTITSQELQYVPQKDNETIISIQYFKTNDGENYINLPQRFDVKITDTASDAWLKGTGAAGVLEPFSRTRCSTDFRRFNLPTPAYAKDPDGFYIRKNDNKRFSIYRRTGTTYHRKQIKYYNEDLPDEDSERPPISNDPAYDDYIPYIENIPISITPGFNSPSDIADAITSQLKKGKEPKSYQIVDNSGVIRQISTIYNNNTWNAFNCAAHGRWSSDGYDAYTLLSSASATPSSASRTLQLEYYNSFEHIGVKRPEIFEFGRKMNGTGYPAWDPTFDNRLSAAYTHADRETATLQTRIQFNEINCSKISMFLKQQAIYPDLIENENTKKWLFNASQQWRMRDTTNTRYLHIQPNSASAATATDFLGCDNNEPNDNKAGTPIQVRDELVDWSSRPIFFYYDEVLEDTFTDGRSTDNMCYGFCTSSIDGFIILHPELIGGSRETLFLGFHETSTEPIVPGDPPDWHRVDIPIDSRIGYDYHFNAYGTATIIPYTGVLPTDIYEHQINSIIDADQPSGAITTASQTPIYSYVNQIYMGANDPLFNFDEVNSRFTFSRLHTAETAGQANMLAGIDYPNAPQNNLDAKDEVYKINKRLNGWNFCPAMVPYLGNGSMSVEYHNKWVDGTNPVASTTLIYSLFNENLEPFEVFDTKCGIFITDLGYDKESWDGGLWETLGFSYDQFNSQDTTRQTRITETNKTKLSVITTNSEIVSTDTQAYVVNPFGAALYTIQLTTPSLIGASGTEGEFKAAGIKPSELEQGAPIFPAITENTGSIIISAKNLPKKMKTGAYYTIRSSLIDRPSYIGAKSSNSLLPVMHICDKQYSGGDFYFSSETQETFKITKPTTISEITTSIHDSDGSYARVDEDSSVIYRITKNLKINTDLISTLVNNSNKKSK